MIGVYCIVFPNLLHPGELPADLLACGTGSSRLEPRVNTSCTWRSASSFASRESRALRVMLSGISRCSSRPSGRRMCRCWAPWRHCPGRVSVNLRRRGTRPAVADLPASLVEILLEFLDPISDFAVFSIVGRAALGPWF